MGISQEVPHNERSASSVDPRGHYLVVARRYRPRSFDELVGQEPVTQALRNAITSNRVGHAYLFTGARGVGKTSAARIFAKALNCQKGPSAQPDNTCDICLSIDAGEDIDVLEIDGASNRGIEEIRQLRSNVHIRPSRAAYKVYIIDEVHMLTMAAFNALLKTLEEPPEHVKFIFCTTDPEKVPITVLSRCQRYDFAPIRSDDILARLRFILQREGREADENALTVLARRAAGSMRDSQSLLEQLLAFGGQRITLQDVNAMLGTADHSMLDRLLARLLERDAAGALAIVEEASRQGIDAGHLAEQLLTLLRDLLVASVGGDPSLALQADLESWPALAERGRSVGIETLMAIMQIMDHALVRMRQSTHGRVLLELALIRIATLSRLDDLAEVIASLRAAPGGPSPSANRSTRPGPTSASSAGQGASAEKKTREVGGPESEVVSRAKASDRGAAIPTPHIAPSRSDPLLSVPAAASPSRPAVAVAVAEPLDESAPSPSPPRPAPVSDRPLFTSENLEEIWKRTLEAVGDIAGDMLAKADRVAISGPNRLVVYFSARYNLAKDWCERSDRKSQIEKALREVSGAAAQIAFETSVGEDVAEPTQAPPVRTARQRMKESERHAMVVRAMELFDAEIVRVDPPAAEPSAR